MARGVIFWVIMIVWFVFGLVLSAGVVTGIGHYGVIGGQLLEFVLFLLVGWQVYGPPVHG